MSEFSVVCCEYGSEYSKSVPVDVDSDSYELEVLQI
jgi:hypothetical protein